MQTAIPDLPVDGHVKHTDGQTYVVRSVALSMGFTPPFLLKWKKADTQHWGEHYSHSKNSFGAGARMASSKYASIIYTP